MAGSSGGGVLAFQVETAIGAYTWCSANEQRKRPAEGVRMPLRFAALWPDAEKVQTLLALRRTGIEEAELEDDETWWCRSSASQAAVAMPSLSPALRGL
jgi:hypothetical protein